MRLKLAVAGLMCLLSTKVQALDYPGTCRGPSAVVTDISGADSRFASMTAKLTRVDALQFCKSEYAVGTSMNKCVSDMTQTTYKSQANCFTGILTNSSGGLPKPGYPQSTWRVTYKFPISPMCASDNNQAISIFKMLCPSYRGQIEE